MVIGTLNSNMLQEQGLIRSSQRHGSKYWVFQALSLESKGSQVKIKIQFFDKSKYKVFFLDYSLLLILVSLSSDWTTTCQQPGALL